MLQREGIHINHKKVYCLNKTAELALNLKLKWNCINALIDKITRKCIALEVDTSITGQNVTRYLNKGMLFRGRPKGIFSDNGSKFTQ